MNTLFFILPRLSFILSGNRILDSLVMLNQFWWFTLTRKLFNFTSPMLFKFNFNENSFSMNLVSTIDILTLKEIYLDKEYDWTLEGEMNVIFDLGAHHGDTALYYHALYPEAKIIAVEASPEAFEILKMNTASIENIILVEAAIGSVDGAVQFNLTKSSLGSSVVERATATSTVIVEQVTLQTLCIKFGIDEIDLIKFDVEGAEKNLFMGLPLSKYFIGEVHLDLISLSLDKFLKRFEDYQTFVRTISVGRRYLVRAKKYE